MRILGLCAVVVFIMGIPFSDGALAQIGKNAKEKGYTKSRDYCVDLASKRGVTRGSGYGDFIRSCRKGEIN